MKASENSGDLTFQSPGKSNSWMLKRLLLLLKDDTVTRAQFLVAYVTWQGLGQLAPSIESFLRRGRHLETIYGVDNDVTTPDALLYSYFLRDTYSNYKYAGVFKDTYRNSTFHPKLFVFHREDELELLIGSANLTRGGLFMNTEAVLHVRTSKQSLLAKQYAESWTRTKKVAASVSPDNVRALVKKNKLNTENQAENFAPEKPAISGKFPAYIAPVSSAVLKSNTKRTRKHLSELDAATDKPKKLYLQVFKTETGGTNSSAGYQIQLPVGCLSSYFGVAPDEERTVNVKMLGEDLTVGLTHFPNHTHRIRLKPLLKVSRPAVIVFERTGADQYMCKPVPRKSYKLVLARKCTEQQRKGARRWGME